MKTTSTKTVLLAFAAIFAVLLAAPPSSDARDYRISGQCACCGCPIYEQTIFEGCDTNGRPIRKWLAVSHICQARSYRPGSYHHNHGGLFGLVGGVLFGCHHHHGYRRGYGYCR